MIERSIEPLAAGHERRDFDCGQPALNDFLRQHAGQYERRCLGRTFVAVATGNRQNVQVDGFYTLSAGAVAFECWTDELRRKLPRHPVPVVHLGRLAVDLRCRGQRLGETLLLDALRRAFQLAQEAGVFAVEVLAIDDAAQAFYLKYGFAPLLDDQRHLYLTTKTIRAIVNRG